MRVVTYSGTCGDCIEVNTPTDLYPLIDWFYNKMVKLKGVDATILNNILNVGDYAEQLNLGDESDVEKVKYI